MRSVTVPVNRIKRAPKAQAIAEAALLRGLAATGLLAQLADGQGVLAMIPIYSFSARNIVAGKWNRGWRSGWRYFWTHPNCDFGVTVEVRRVSGSDPKLASVSTGRAAVALARALCIETRNLAAGPARYRARILRLPWISMEALWFNTDPLDVADKFISRDNILRNGAFLQEAKQRATSFRERIEAQKRTTKQSLHSPAHPLP